MVDLIATNSIIDFNSSKSKGSKTITFEKESDVKDIFICNLFFYLVSCYSLLIHVFIDLVFASYLGKKVNKYFMSNNIVIFFLISYLSYQYKPELILNKYLSIPYYRA
tara:strand:+ start:269 stop:592 length:324 start_codon:yes stop_codon:yes gene_type:complete